MVYPQFAYEEGNIPVECIRLDSIKYLLNNKIKILKIDTEGYEFEVLKGAKEIFELNKPDHANNRDITKEYSSFIRQRRI